MLDRGLGVVFDREVVDDKGEDDTVSGMLEEACRDRQCSRDV